MIAKQRPLKGSVLYRQRAAVARMKASERMDWIGCMPESRIAQRFGILRTRQILSLQHLAFAQLRSAVEQRMGEHIQETVQTFFELTGR